MVLHPPKNLVYRKNLQRVTIHPTSSSKNKNWPPNRFIKLARKLRNHNWEPVFCVAPKEWNEWNNLLQNEFPLFQFPQLSDLAAFIYESAFMIGCDSGPGHLASCLAIPTLTIWKKLEKLSRPYSHRWRPGWGFGLVIAPKFKTPIFNTQLWKYLISVTRVYDSFKKLVSESATKIVQPH